MIIFSTIKPHKDNFIETIPLPPIASSLIESLRDIGYSFETAIADIIDNSITANAKNIKIYFKFYKEKLSISIIDDGNGMNKETLINAMRAGSKNPLEDRDPNDLGRFGLGLKTASFSQCRKLTVASLQDNEIYAAKWDLDFIAKEDKWSLQILDKNEIKNIFKIQNLDTQGTLVLWEDTDRIIDTTEKELTEDVIYEKFESVQKHLELIFHRFLEGRGKINIFINDEKLVGFDPFHSNHMSRDELAEETIIINDKKIVIQPYILPHYSKVSAQDYEYYAGEGGYLKNQGFYVYRNKRLLISGTWFRLIPQSEMYKLARIQIDLPNNLDDLWKIDVKKSNASPPAVIRDRLKKIIGKIAGSSTRVYKSKGHRSVSTNNAFWERHKAHGSIKYNVNKEHPFINKFISDLSEEKQYEFMHILNLIGDFLPKDALYSDIGNNNPKTINPKEITDLELEELAINKVQTEQELMTSEEFINFFKTTEPFNIYSKDWGKFIENMEEHNGK